MQGIESQTVWDLLPVQTLVDLCDKFWGALFPLGVRCCLWWVSGELPVFSHHPGSRREVWLSSCSVGSGSCAAQGCGQDEFNKAAQHVFPYLREILCVPESSTVGHRCLWRKEEQWDFLLQLFTVPISLKCLCGFSLGGANQQNNRQKLMRRKFLRNVRKEILCCVNDHVLECGVSLTGGIQELSGGNPVPWSSESSCFEQGGWTRWFPTWPVLWLRPWGSARQQEVQGCVMMVQNI